jgi:hypothetical protein
MIFPVAHKKRVYLKGGHSRCAFCHEAVSWCKCKQNCNEGYHNWADNCDRCVYCHAYKFKQIKQGE